MSTPGGGVNLGSQIPKIAIFNFFLIDYRMAFKLFLGMYRVKITSKNALKTFFKP